MNGTRHTRFLLALTLSLFANASLSWCTAVQDSRLTDSIPGLSATESSGLSQENGSTSAVPVVDVVRGELARAPGHASQLLLAVGPPLLPRRDVDLARRYVRSLPLHFDFSPADGESGYIGMLASMAQPLAVRWAGTAGLGLSADSAGSLRIAIRIRVSHPEGVKGVPQVLLDCRVFPPGSDLPVFEELGVVARKSGPPADNGDLEVSQSLAVALWDLLDGAMPLVESSLEQLWLGGVHYEVSLADGISEVQRTALVKRLSGLSLVANIESPGKAPLLLWYFGSRSGLAHDVLLAARTVIGLENSTVTPAGDGELRVLLP